MMPFLLDTLPSNSTAFLIPAQATAISQPRTSFLRDKNYYDRPTEEGRARLVSMDGGVEAEISFLCLFWGQKRGVMLRTPNQRELKLCWLVNITLT